MRPKQARRGEHRKPQTIYSLEEANDRLYDIFSHHDFKDFPHQERLLLAHFYRLLMTHQLADNVTRLIKFRDIAIKHFIDCLIVPRLTQLTFPLLDVGTGPGFPGIPLKIVFPNERIILAEGVKRRVDFLKVVREEMKLAPLDIVGRNVDENFVYPVKGVITRAVEDITKTLHNVSQCLEVGGKVFLMKGPKVDHEIVAAKRRMGPFYELLEDHAYSLPHTPHKRRLVVFRKVESPPVKTSSLETPS